MTIHQRFPILTVMEDDQSTEPAGRLFLEERMAARGMDDDDVAEAIGVESVTVWRWRNHERTPRQPHMRKLEDLFHTPPGGLYKRPENGNEGELLAGLNAERRKAVMEYIQYQFTKQKDDEPPRK